MKKLLVAATFVALAAGATAVGALDNKDLKGSDTLNKITQDVLLACPGANPAGPTGLAYIGTGSGAGEAALLLTSNYDGPAAGVDADPTACTNDNPSGGQLDCQTVASMSRFLTAGNTCLFPQLATLTKDSSKAEGIAFSLDGLSVVTSGSHDPERATPPLAADPAKTCTAGPDDCNRDNTGNPAGDTGLARNKLIAVDANANGIAGLQCPRCTGTNYQMGGNATHGWKDVLRLLYTGLAWGSGTTALENDMVDRDCAGDLRATLVKNWGNLFQPASGCQGSAGCTQLRHAFRRDDESGTTDVFLALLGLPSLNIGTGVSPFCNVSQTGDNDSADATAGEQAWGGRDPSGQSLQDCPYTLANSNSLVACSNTVACTSNPGGVECLADGAPGAPLVACPIGGTVCTGFCYTRDHYPGCNVAPRPAPAAGQSWIGGWKRGSATSGPYYSDYQDNDPFRTLCENASADLPNPTPPTVADFGVGAAEQVCGGRRRRAVDPTTLVGQSTLEPAGTLGLVLPINPPPDLSVAPEPYPNVACERGTFASGQALNGVSPAPKDPDMWLRRGTPAGDLCNLPGVACPAGSYCSNQRGDLLTTGSGTCVEDCNLPSDTCSAGSLCVNPSGDEVTAGPGFCATAPTVDRCPNGDIPAALLNNGGTCSVPVSATGSTLCLNGRNNLPASTIDGNVSSVWNRSRRIEPVKVSQSSGAGMGDGRVYNLHLRGATTGNPYQKISRPGATAAVNITGAFYRIHSTRTLLSTATCASGVCCNQVDATRQIGCLVQASPCTIGYAGREATSIVLNSDVVGTEYNTAIKVDLLEPSITCVRNLITAPASAYPASRHLYLTSMFGFETAVGTQEYELAKCFGGKAPSTLSYDTGVACTGGPGAQGTCPVGQICSAATGGTCRLEDLAGLEQIVTNAAFITRGSAPACQDWVQQTGCTSPQQDCDGPGASTSTAAGAGDACANNTLADLPNDDPLVTDACP